MYVNHWSSSRGSSHCLTSVFTVCRFQNVMCMRRQIPLHSPSRDGMLSNGEVPRPASKFSSPEFQNSQLCSSCGPGQIHFLSLQDSMLHLQSGDHNRTSLIAFSRITDKRSGNPGKHPLSATGILNIIIISDSYCPAF